MKQICIRKENYNLEELMGALERETSAVGRYSGKNPLKMLQDWLGSSNILAIDCDSDGLILYTSSSLIEGKEIHCMKDFVEAVKEQFPKKEEIFCVDLKFVDRKSLLGAIEAVSSILWFSNDKPTQCAATNDYLEICDRDLLNSNTSENKTELTPAQFLVKCAELHPQKSVYDDLKKGDVCLVRDGDGHLWASRIYHGNRKFTNEASSNICTYWKQVKPTGVNVYDVLKGEN